MSRFLALFILCALFAAAPLSAQTPEREAERDLEYGNQRSEFANGGRNYNNPVWFGGGAVLGFSSDNRFSQFQIGISPIVGYKLNNFLSVGPRGSIVYNSYRDDFLDFKAKYVNWSAGVFTRAIVYRPFFVHAEYSLVNDVLSFDANGDGVRTTRAIPFLGGGISQGGGPGSPGFEFMVLFRLTQSEFINDSPFQIRTGLNFNF